MANNNSGEAIGAVIGGMILLALIIAAVVAAVIIVLGAGSLIGTGVGFANYFKAFRANVHLERPGAV